MERESTCFFPLCRSPLFIVITNFFTRGCTRRKERAERLKRRRRGWLIEEEEAAVGKNGAGDQTKDGATQYWPVVRASDGPERRDVIAGYQNRRSSLPVCLYARKHGSRPANFPVCGTGRIFSTSSCFPFFCSLCSLFARPEKNSISAQINDVILLDLI